MTSVASSLAKGFLLFSDAIIISPFLIMGFATRGGFFIQPPSYKGELIWGNASLLVLFTMIFNVFLKSIFLVPLNPALGIQGYAFPSGHMQVAFVFYGFLAITYAGWIGRVVLMTILIGIGYGLVQQGYHTLMDVAGSVMFSLATLWVFMKLISVGYIKRNYILVCYYLIFLCSLMMGWISLRIGLKSYVLKTFFGLVAFLLLWGILNKTVWKQRGNFA